MSRLPEHCGIAFKEWEGVCNALLDGRQTLIVRKGGISEDEGVFTPEHRVFWLYPTHVHQAQQGLRLEADSATAAGTVPPRADRVSIRALATVELIRYVDKEEQLPALEEFHVWTPETIQKRFHYRRPGFWVLGVRVFRRAEPISVAVTAEQLGCKTWVALDPPLPTAGLEAARDDRDWNILLDRLINVLDPGDRTGNLP